MNMKWMGLLTLLFIGCGGANTANTADGTPATNSGAPETASVAMEDFNSLDFNARRQYMADTIVPEMGKLFKSEHPDFGCITCHGADSVDVNYEMPNTLDPLDPQNMPFTSEDEKRRATATWMKDVVVPKMATLLNEPIHDPATGKGFGCFNCHAKK